jgi:ABC-type sugar transport system substrate-binding protein
MEKAVQTGGFAALQGKGQQIGKWFDDYLRTLISTFGAAGIGVFGVLLQNPTWYYWVGMGLSVGLSVYGAILSVQATKRESVQNEKIAKLENKLAAARDPKRVFFVTSALSDNWQLLLEQSLLHQLRTRGFRPTIFAPLINFSSKEQEIHFNEIMERKDDYIGGFAIPVSPKTQKQKLLEFISAFGKPVVFIDNAPFDVENDYLDNASFIGVDNIKGGTIAAQAVLDCHHKVAISTVLVIASTSQVERQESFVKTLASEAPEIKVIIDDGGRFTRIDAYNSTLRHLRSAISARSKIDIIFCTSDSMTLGCLDALQSISESSPFQLPKIIGYDGIAETKRLVDSPISPLMHIVIQNHHEVAVGAISEFDQLLNKQRKMPIQLLDPHLYPTRVLVHS